MMPALLAGLLGALACLGFAWLAVDGLWRPDAFDYAQIGRQLAEGHGMTSRHAIYALHLEFLKSHGLLQAHWPNLHRFPLPPLLLAAGFRLFGVHDAVVVGYGIVFHAATSALLFAWARRLLGVSAGVACVLLVSLNGTFLEVACSGLSEPPVIFFFTLALFALLGGGRGASPPARAALSGAALALAGLARTNALFAAPLFALALLARRPGSRWREAAWTLAAFVLAIVLVSLPWWLRNLWLAGDPFFSLHSYFLLPSGLDAAVDKWDLSVPWVREWTPPAEVLLARPGAVAAKAWRNLSRWLVELPDFAGLLGVVPLAALALLPRVGGELHRFARLVLACFAWNALLVGFTDFFLPKYHLHLVPALVLLAVAVVWRLAARLPQPGLRAAVCAVAVLVMADLGGVREAVGWVRASQARYDRHDWQEIRRRTAEDAIVVSDQSHAVAWETGRRSVRLHYDRTPEGALVLGVSTLEDLYLPVDAVHLSRPFLRDPGKREALRRTLSLPRFRREFPRIHAVEGGGLLLQRAAEGGTLVPQPAPEGGTLVPQPAPEGEGPLQPPS